MTSAESDDATVGNLLVATQVRMSHWTAETSTIRSVWDFTGIDRTYPRKLRAFAAILALW